MPKIKPIAERQRFKNWNGKRPRGRLRDYAKYLTQRRRPKAEKPLRIRGISESNKLYELLWNYEKNEAIAMVNEMYNCHEPYIERWEARYRRYFNVQW